MKHNYIKKAFLFTCLFTGVYSINAQENRELKHIEFNESSKVSLQKAPDLIKKRLKLFKDDRLHKLTSTKDDIGFTHEKYQQKFKGVKVEFATYTAHAKNGVLKSMNGEFYDVGKVNTTPKLSKEQAFKKALSHTGAEKYLWEFPEAAKEMDNYKKPEGELLILPKEVIGKKEPKLAYKFDIFATKPLSRGYLYIDAHTGETLFYNAIIKHADKFGHVGNITKYAKKSNKAEAATAFVTGTAQTRYSGTKSIETALSGGSYILSDAGRKVYTRDAKNQSPGATYPYISNYNQFTDNDNNWTTAEHSANKDNAALDAHWGAMMTYDYFLQKHNRNSYDGNGAQIRSYVHVDVNYDNAFWNGSVMSYGDGSSNGQEGNGYFDALTSIDVAAHEIGHAVCSNTANLAYQRESGALNEGFSDIWGAAVEHFAKGNGNDLNPSLSVWLIGDEIDRRTGSAALRSMNDPKSLGQPDTYGGTYWKNPNCGTPTRTNDYCGVHTNSGVLNKWFYLLTAGGSGSNDVGDNYNVTGIGMAKAAKIAYRTEANYLSANATFSDARAGAIQAATDLYGANSQEVISTTNAFYAVNVGEEFVQACALAAPGNLSASNIGDNGFTVSWNAVSGAASYDVTVAGNTTNVTSTSFNVTGLISGTQYAVTVVAKCATGGTGTSATLNVTTTGNPPLNYCSSKGNSVADEYIGRVQLGTINNSSGAGNGYTDYTNISTNLAKSTSHTITITPTWTGTVYNEGYGVWIDYNQDGDFSDAGETVWTKSPSQTTPVSTSFTVPSGALEGATRMRIVMKYNATPTACEATFSYGEVEDYTVVIGAGTADTQAPSAPTNLTASNVTQTTLTLSWSASTDNVGVTGYDVYRGTTKIATVTGTSASVTGLAASTTYSFSVRAKDAAGNVSSSSNTINVTTLSNTVSYCGSQGNNSSYEWIDNVELGGMTNATGDNGGYADFTSKTATLSQGSSNQMIVSADFSSTSYTEYWAVWIDFNQNGTFESSEKVVSGSSSSANNLTATVNVPSGASLGTTRMRVSMKYNSAQTSCEAFSYGEVEDYTVNIVSSTSVAEGLYGFSAGTGGESLGNENSISFMAYPNPVVDYLQVKLASKADDITYKIINTIGSVVKQGRLNNSNINVSGLQTGMYILEVNDGQKLLTTKVFKK
ncbi:M4 family metallopeptidase [Tenacibaculum tangerinum]|uniref:M4 family metallopeptidase n=1 Tax=Tenacibaculum tangerinum TaxID=3038772 RepID=A0ABY8L2S3_9FLAO|nr:M4 family metallopeptidase [Tenacibaculum tangerinum]WGH74503.1 M4 family metallopeptidase [Tenacibaculum tangerinum]